MLLIDPVSIAGMRLRSFSGPITSAPVLALSSRLPPEWSQWWWVLRIWVSRAPWL